MTERHIVAISGGGFSEQEHAIIDRYILNIKRKSTPLHIIFIPTASHDAEGYIRKFYKTFAAEQPSHLTIDDFSSPDTQQTVNEADIIYVGGGNTAFMLNVWRETGFDKVLIQAYKRGVILAGISAGAMCWFDACVTDDIEEKNIINGLGLLKGSLYPHFTEHEDTSAVSDLTPLYLLKDEENLHFINEKLVTKIISY